MTLYWISYQEHRASTKLQLLVVILINGDMVILIVILISFRNSESVDFF